jgi:hypothetical protein
MPPGIRGAGDNVGPGEMVSSGKQAGCRGPVDVLDVIGVIVPLGEGVEAVYVVRIILIVVASRATPAGADEDKIAAIAKDAIYLLVSGALESRPIGGGDVSLPGRDVNSQGAGWLRVTRLAESQDEGGKSSDR